MARPRRWRSFSWNARRRRARPSTSSARRRGRPRGSRTGRARGPGRGGLLDPRRAAHLRAHAAALLHNGHPAAPLRGGPRASGRHARAGGRDARALARDGLFAHGAARVAAPTAGHATSAARAAAARVLYVGHARCGGAGGVLRRIRLPAHRRARPHLPRADHVPRGRAGGYAAPRRFARGLVPQLSGVGQEAAACRQGGRRRARHGG